VVYVPTLYPVNFQLSIVPDSPQLRELIIQELRDVFWKEGIPGGTIPLTHLAEAVSQTAGEYDHIMYLPNTNVTVTADFLPVIGQVNFV
jgi:uncharacterized phage protein gp47/JayE